LCEAAACRLARVLILAYVSTAASRIRMALASALSKRWALIVFCVPM